MRREGHCQQISPACVGSAHSVWTTLGLPQLTVACAFHVYTAQAPGCTAGALSKADPAFCALLRSEPLTFRFSGNPQGCRLCWACVLCTSQVGAVQVTRCLVSALSQVATHLNHLSGPSHSVSRVHHESTDSAVPCVSSGELIPGCNPPGRRQLPRIPGRRG